MTEVVVLLVMVFLVIGLGGGLVLYALVRAETTRRPVMDREAAERTARRDTASEDER